MPEKEKCPVCHCKTSPVSMMRDDTITVHSKDGYLLTSKSVCGAPKGYIQDVCRNCGYVLHERRGGEGD